MAAAQQAKDIVEQGQLDFEVTLDLAGDGPITGDERITVMQSQLRGVEQTMLQLELTMSKVPDGQSAVQPPEFRGLPERLDFVAEAFREAESRSADEWTLLAGHLCKAAGFLRTTGGGAALAAAADSEDARSALVEKAVDDATYSLLSAEQAMMNIAQGGVLSAALIEQRDLNRWRELSRDLPGSDSPAPATGTIDSLDIDTLQGAIDPQRFDPVVKRYFEKNRDWTINLLRSALSLD